MYIRNCKAMRHSAKKVKKKIVVMSLLTLYENRFSLSKAEKEFEAAPYCLIKHSCNKNHLVNSALGEDQYKLLRCN